MNGRRTSTASPQYRSQGGHLLTAQRPWSRLYSGRTLFTFCLFGEKTGIKISSADTIWCRLGDFFRRHLPRSVDSIFIAGQRRTLARSQRWCTYMRTVWNVCLWPSRYHIGSAVNIFRLLGRWLSLAGFRMILSP